MIATRNTKTFRVSQTLKVWLDRSALVRKNARLVILALLANFVLVPLLALAITRVLLLDQSLQIGLIVLATTADAASQPHRTC